MHTHSSHVLISRSDCGVLMDAAKTSSCGRKANTFDTRLMCIWAAEMGLTLDSQTIARKLQLFFVYLSFVSGFKIARQRLRWRTEMLSKYIIISLHRSG